MLRVDSWLDVASLENVKEDHSVLFLKKNLMKIFFFFLKILEILNFFKELKILINVFFLNQPKKYEPNAPSPKAFFWKFPFFFFFSKYLERIYLFIYFLKYEDLFIIKKWRRGRWRWSKSDEDLFMLIFLFFFLKTYPLNENNFGWKLMQIAG